jgi:3-phenylpropionate/trans-cinnamate dioxygenase ferredoxin reductase subunit
MSGRIVIVGAGQAGLQTALSLRQGGFDGALVLLGGEAHAPYQRPPLSKQVLKGEWPPEKCQLRTPAFLEQQGIDFRPGTRAITLDTKRRQVALADDRVIDYDQLAICTGARLNRLELSGSGLTGIHYLRTVDDAVSLREALKTGAHLTVAGGGYIGLEVAASARELGCEVDLIEPQPRLMQRSTLPPISAWFEARHRQEGIRLHLGHLMTEILGGDRVRAVTLDDGTLIETELLLEGIGVRPELDWLEGSGIDTNRGVLVDQRCRTNVDGVFAAGDVCEGLHPLLEGQVLLESVQNAVSQGKVVAANMLGQKQSYADVPWFWSEQFGQRLQMAGLPRAGDELVIREHDPHSMTVMSLGTERLHAVQCINAPRDYMAARKLIAGGRVRGLQRLRDPSTNIEELL